MHWGCSFLGEALRAVLVLEMRTLTVTSASACARTPAHLPAGCTALRATLKSCSGAEATVVLGGPPNGGSQKKSFDESYAWRCMGA